MMRAAWQMPLHDHDARLCARKAKALADVVLEWVGVFPTRTLVLHSLHVVSHYITGVEQSWVCF